MRPPTEDALGRLFTVSSRRNLGNFVSREREWWKSKGRNAKEKEWEFKGKGGELQKKKKKKGKTPTDLLMLTRLLEKYKNFTT